jgi:hypothetical protein
VAHNAGSFAPGDMQAIQARRLEPIGMTPRRCYRMAGATGPTLASGTYRSGPGYGAAVGPDPE